MRYLLSVLLLVLFACSSESPTDNSSDVGSAHQSLHRRTFDAVVPANDTYSLLNSTYFTQDGFIGPFWVGLSGWVVQDDPAAGALVFDITYVDPTGSTRTMNFGGVSPTLQLNDPSSFFATPAVWMIRQSGSSAWDLNIGLGGSAGDSLVHYEIMVGPNYEDDWWPFTDQP